MKKICVVTPSLNMGGMERAGVNFSECLNLQGHEVMLLALFKHEKFFQIPSGIRFEEPDTTEPTRRLNIFSTAIRIRKLVCDFKPDSILVMNELYGAITLLALAGLRYPVFISDRASPLYHWPARQKVFKDLIFKFFQPEGVVAQTKISAEYKKRYFKSHVRIEVIPNPLREIKLYPQIQKKNQVLAVGRKSDPLKGFDRLLEAFALAQTEDWSLVFAGIGPDDDGLVDQAKNLGIEDKVIFLGKVADIDRIYAESRIFVIPSRSEGFPNALCEAMAAGLPCIAYDFVAGPRDLIEDGVNGLLVENGNIQGLSRAIERLIHAKAERERLSAGAAKIKEKLNIGVVGERLADFIFKGPEEHQKVVSTRKWQPPLVRDIRTNIKNMIGWSTRRKIVVFEVDDYGNIRVASREARERMVRAGMGLSANAYDQYDALEDKEDLLGLYEVLTSVKDKDGKHPVFTAFTVPASPDFDRIKEEDFSKYYYELLPDVLNQLPGHEGVWDLWREGIDRKILHPQFHGREHLNVKLLMESLRRRHHDVRTSFENYSYCGITKSLYPDISYVAAFDFDRFEENEGLKNIIVDGLNAFERIFGFRAKCFCAPGRPAHSCLEKTLLEHGIRYITVPAIKKEHQGAGRYKKTWNYLGKKGPLGQTYIVRNCEFSPMIGSPISWVDCCLKQIEAAFRWHKPAIISSHRVNFCGHIEPAVRANGLKLLRDLLKRIVTRWPEVEFMPSVGLDELIKSS